MAPRARQHPGRLRGWLAGGRVVTRLPVSRSGRRLAAACGLLCLAAASSGLEFSAAGQQPVRAEEPPGRHRLLAQGNVHVRVRDLDNIRLGRWNGLTDLAGSDGVCVFSSTQIYTVTARGNGPGGQFALAGAGGGEVPFSVEWTDDNGRTQTLSAGAVSGAMSARTHSAACQGGTNATVTVRISSAHISRGVAGTLSGTILLELSPSN